MPALTPCPKVCLTVSILTGKGPSYDATPLHGQIVIPAPATNFSRMLYFAHEKTLISYPVTINE
jgi:hypothetical protein